jgi:hypothetical protein
MYMDYSQCTATYWYHSELSLKIHLTCLEFTTLIWEHLAYLFHWSLFSVLLHFTRNTPIVTIFSNSDFNHTNGVSPLLADNCNLFSLSSIGRNSMYVGCSWRLPSSEWFCCWRWQTHTRIDLTTGDDSAISFHEGDLLQSRLEVC